MSRHPIVIATAALSVLVALGSAALAIAHSGIEVPVLSALGPGGGAAVPSAAIAFTIAAVVLTVVTVGLWRGRAWAWAAGLAVHGVVLAGAAMPYRGLGSLVGILLAGTAFVLLASRAGRSALLELG